MSGNVVSLFKSCTDSPHHPEWKLKSLIWTSRFYRLILSPHHLFDLLSHELCLSFLVLLLLQPHWPPHSSCLIAVSSTPDLSINYSLTSIHSLCNASNVLFSLRLPLTSLSYPTLNLFNLFFPIALIVLTKSSFGFFCSFLEMLRCYRKTQKKVLAYAILFLYLPLFLFH